MNVMVGGHEFYAIPEATQQAVAHARIDSSNRNIFFSFSRSSAYEETHQNGIAFRQPC